MCKYKTFREEPNKQREREMHRKDEHYHYKAIKVFRNRPPKKKNELVNRSAKELMSTPKNGLCASCIAVSA